MNVALKKATLATAALFLLFWILNNVLDGGVWTGMTPSQSALKVEYCEFNNPANFFHQKMNSYTNLAYAFFGFIAIFLGLNDRNLVENNVLVSNPSLSIIYGAILVYLCIGSCFFHASLTLLGQRIDMNATYGLNIWAIFASFHCLIPKYRSVVPWIIGLGMAIMGFLAPKVSSGNVLPIMFLSIIFMQILIYFRDKGKRYIWLLICSFLLLILAIKIRQIDVDKGWFCSPGSWFQGHALWHVLTAISSFLGYLYLRFRRSFKPF